MNDFEKAKNWYSDVVVAQSLEQRKSWYGEVAEAYNKARPRYPQELIAHALTAAKLPEAANILEVGCGPGNATTAFAQLGFSMTCLEPNQVFCHLLRQNCVNYPAVEIVNNTFEEWEPKTNKFHAVLAANSWHWISPEIGHLKAAKVLCNGGSLTLLWNMTPQPPYEIYQASREVYQALVPSLARYEDKKSQEESLRGLGQNMIDSGLFKDLVYKQLANEVIYSIDDYLTLLSTLSSYKMLEPKKRNALFKGLQKVIDKNYGSSIQVSYLSAFHIAQKI